MIPHVAIPAKDIKESQWFYEYRLGARAGRFYPNSVVLNFHGIQLVLHKSDEIDKVPKMYPRHIGIILNSEAQLKTLWDIHGKELYVFEPLFTRHQKEREEHKTFFLKDPSNNLIEFKWYNNPNVIFGV